MLKNPMMKKTVSGLASFGNRVILGKPDHRKKRAEKEMEKKKKRLNLYAVILNVYDAPGAANLNRHLYRLGFGRYFSTVNVHAAEYVFMADTNGIRRGRVDSFARENGLDLRSWKLIGFTTKNAAEVQQEIDILVARGFGSDAEYHAINNNCNHFSDEFCRALTGKGIPQWVNRINTTIMIQNLFAPL